MIAVKLIVYKCRTSSTKPECLITTVTPPGSESMSSDLLSTTLPLRHTFSYCSIFSGADQQKRRHEIWIYMRNVIKFNKKMSYYCDTFRSNDIAMLILKDSYLQQKLIKFILEYYVWNLLKNFLDIFCYFFHLNQDFMAKF